MLSVGELNRNKNHEIVIRTLAELQDERIHYAIAGTGELQDYLTKLTDTLGISERVHLLGYRKDVQNLYRIADMYVLPSLREGLNVSLMEAIASGLPVICSKIRGNVDLVEEKELLFDPRDRMNLRKCLIDSFDFNVRKTEKKHACLLRIIDSNEIIHKMKKIYEKV